MREDEEATIIANDIKDFGEQKLKILTLDITNLDETHKNKLRGALHYFHGDKNNINVQVKVGEEYKPCGQLYVTDEIFEFLGQIIGKENVTF